MKIPRNQQASESARPEWQPIPAWSWMLAAVAAVAIAAFAVTTWLLAIAGHAAPGTAVANARLDAVRTGLAAGAGAGAAVGLMLAFRRQHHQEIATVLTDLDATERRITELYTKAVEQLGSDKAPVRLGGLYALERLAQDNPAHRPTIVNVICAYLRMPFPTGNPASEVAEDAGELVTEDAVKTAADGDTWQQELQVRLTAQRILAEHLRDRDEDKRATDPSRIRFWPKLLLDLTGATLIDFDLSDGSVAGARFDGATFSGMAVFAGASFVFGARFDRATFNGDARFDEATLIDARFDEATFNSDARFDQARLTHARFDEATFNGDARFNEARFRGELRFSKATFSGSAVFREAIFRNVASFDVASFSGDASFSGAAFHEGVVFDKATFSGEARFGGTTFNVGASFDGAVFGGRVDFGFSEFGGVATFDGATFSEGADALDFNYARVLSANERHVWPTGWCLNQTDTGHTVVHTNGNTQS